MNANLFLNTVLRETFAAMHGLEPDNYDAGRYSFDGVDRSGVFDNDRHANYMAFFAEHYESFFTTWLLLRDEASRKLFTRLVQYRLLGHLHVRVQDDAGAQAEQSLFGAVARWARGASGLPVAGPFGTLQHFEGVEFDGGTLQLDCWAGNIVYTFLKQQYFLERGGVRIQPEAGDFIIDAGACLGDTAAAFAARAGRDGRVFAFDPLPSHVTASQHNLEQNGFADRAAVVPLALGNVTRNTGVRVGQDGGVSPGFSVYGNEDRLPMVTIDDFVAAERPARVDFIKMDIEGAELAALEGAVDTMARHRPKLAISLYHRPEDFVTIPRFLSTMLPDYDFHLGHYTIHQEETVLYGRPRLH
jgi:FkbM family methyltransferase